MLKTAISAPFSKGVNFTNWLEYRPTDQIREDMFGLQDFKDIKSLGCDVVRIPIHFEQFCHEDDGYKIPEKILKIMDNIAVWAEETQIYAILDFHNSTHIDSVTATDVDKILFPVWTELANRYKDSTEYLVFELMNEPHGIEIEVWNEIILRLFKHVRDIDKKHYIIVGGADWNSFAGMCALPDFEDDRIIYTFHFYDPHTFTHQGAIWCHMERVVGFPFPYSPEKMPALPENPTPAEKACFENYPDEGTLEKVTGFFDKYAEFSISRNAPIYCGEFGCFAPFVDREQRVNWYKTIADILEERNIARTSWDYHGPFGVFRMKGKPGHREPIRFPEDLDVEIVKAMGLSI